ncbi:unnamed protein product [Urochloa humidicola]
MPCELPVANSNLIRSCRKEGDRTTPHQSVRGLTEMQSPKEPQQQFPSNHHQDGQRENPRDRRDASGGVHVIIALPAVSADVTATPLKQGTGVLAFPHVLRRARRLKSRATATVSVGAPTVTAQPAARSTSTWPGHLFPSHVSVSLALYRSS